jgi:hypothetical protein
MHQQLQIISRHRIFSPIVILGCATCVLSYALLRYENVSGLSSAILSIAYVAGLAIGSRLSLWVSLFVDKPSHDAHPKWSTASTVSASTVLVIGMGTGSIEIQVLGALTSVLLMSTYALAKVRCWHLGCCGMPNKTKNRIQLIEAVTTFVFAIVIYVLLVRGKYMISIYSFGVLYPLIRVSFLTFRGSQLKSVVLADLPLLLVWLMIVILTLV